MLFVHEVWTDAQADPDVLISNRVSSHDTVTSAHLVFFFQDCMNSIMNKSAEDILDAVRCAFIMMKAGITEDGYCEISQVALSLPRIANIRGASSIS